MATIIIPQTEICEIRFSNATEIHAMSHLTYFNTTDTSEQAQRELFDLLKRGVVNSFKTEESLVSGESWLRVSVYTKYISEIIAE